MFLDPIKTIPSVKTLPNNSDVAGSNPWITHCSQLTAGQFNATQLYFRIIPLLMLLVILFTLLIIIQSSCIKSSHGELVVASCPAVSWRWSVGHGEWATASFPILPQKPFSPHLFQLPLHFSYSCQLRKAVYSHLKQQDSSLNSPNLTRSLISRDSAEMAISVTANFFSTEC